MCPEALGLDRAEQPGSCLGLLCWSRLLGLIQQVFSPRAGFTLAVLGSHELPLHQLECKGVPTPTSTIAPWFEHSPCGADRGPALPPVLLLNLGQ